MSKVNNIRRIDLFSVIMGLKVTDTYEELSTKVKELLLKYPTFGAVVEATVQVNTLSNSKLRTIPTYLLTKRQALIVAAYIRQDIRMKFITECISYFDEPEEALELLSRTEESLNEKIEYDTKYIKLYESAIHLLLPYMDTEHYGSNYSVVQQVYNLTRGVSIDLPTIAKAISRLATEYPRRDILRQTYELHIDNKEYMVVGILVNEKSVELLLDQLDGILA